MKITKTTFDQLDAVEITTRHARLIIVDGMGPRIAWLSHRDSGNLLYWDRSTRQRSNHQYCCGHHLHDPFIHGECPSGHAGKPGTGDQCGHDCACIDRRSGFAARNLHGGPGEQDRPGENAVQAQQDHDADLLFTIHAGNAGGSGCVFIVLHIHILGFSICPKKMGLSQKYRDSLVLTQM